MQFKYELHYTLNKKQSKYNINCVLMYIIVYEYINALFEYIIFIYYLLYILNIITT